MPQVSLTQLPWYGQISAFVVVCALGVFGFYRFYAAGEDQAIAAQQTRLDGLRVDINKGLATARRLQEFRKEVADLQIRLDALKSILPDQKDYADLLRRIQTLATQSNLTVLSFEPQPVVTRQIHAEWPIKLRLQGTYHALGLFFDKVSKFPRLIDIGDTKIRGAADAPAERHHHGGVHGDDLRAVGQPGAGVRRQARRHARRQAGHEAGRGARPPLRRGLRTDG